MVMADGTVLARGAFLSADIPAEARRHKKMPPAGILNHLETGQAA